MKRKLLSLTLVFVFCLSLFVPVFAAEQSELELAAAYVRQQGIMVGDGHGNLNLDTGLTRAELAVLLTRLRNGEGVLMANTAYFERGCKFVDVPEWARLYVGYCVRNNLVVGYDSLHYGAADPVTPAAACTVVLRAQGIADGEGSVWSYNTACAYAVELGWIDSATANSAVITRGEMAVLIYRAQTGSRPGKPLGNSYLANGKPVTEANVLELLRQIERDWPSGTVWGTHNTPVTHKNEVPSTEANRVMRSYNVSGTYACGGYASMVSSLIFGDKTNPARRVEDLSQIRPGDIIFFVLNDTGKPCHVTIALESPNGLNSFHYTDGNNGGTVYWPDSQEPYSREVLNCYGTEGKAIRVEAWTRYPESVPFTGASTNAWGISAP